MGRGGPARRLTTEAPREGLLISEREAGRRAEEKAKALRHERVAAATGATTTGALAATTGTQMVLEIQVQFIR